MYIVCLVKIRRFILTMVAKVVHQDDFLDQALRRSIENTVRANESKRTFICVFSWTFEKKPLPYTYTQQTTVNPIKFNATRAFYFKLSAGAMLLMRSF